MKTKWPWSLHWSWSWSKVYIRLDIFVQYLKSSEDTHLAALAQRSSFPACSCSSNRSRSAPVFRSSSMVPPDHQFLQFHLMSFNRGVSNKNLRQKQARRKIGTQLKCASPSFTFHQVKLLFHSIWSRWKRVILYS